MSAFRRDVPTADAHMEQKAAWSERKVLKERLLALKEEDLPHILAATGLKLRGEDPAAVWASPGRTARRPYNAY
jgi:hypothetical protein